MPNKTFQRTLETSAAEGCRSVSRIMNQTELVGKMVLVIFSYYDESEKPLGFKQFHGRIVAADGATGIVVHDAEKNEDHTLPPRTDALFPTPPGSYRESATGMTIENPNFMSSWHVKKVGGDNDKWDWHPYRMDLPVSKASDTETRSTEQSAAPLPPAPAGPSEGAR